MIIGRGDLAADERGSVMSKYSLIFAPTPNYIITRPKGNIPWCKPAVDVFRIDEEDKITIHNPCTPWIKPYG